MKLAAIALARASDELLELKRRLASPRSRLRKAAEIDERVEVLLRRHHVARYLKVRRLTREVYRFKQRGPGRPGAATDYRRLTRRHFDLEWSYDDEAIAYDHKTDGMYPLLSNDKALTSRHVLEAHKGQPAIEKRFEQCKTVHEIAPVFLKNEGRIEALFVLYFVGLLVQALIERELRRRMRAEGIEELPVYPEERISTRPTTEQIFRLFSHVGVHVLRCDGVVTEVFQPILTDVQRGRSFACLVLLRCVTTDTARCTVVETEVQGWSHPSWARYRGRPPAPTGVRGPWFEGAGDSEEFELMWVPGREEPQVTAKGRVWKPSEDGGAVVLAWAREGDGCDGFDGLGRSHEHRACRVEARCAQAARAGSRAPGPRDASRVRIRAGGNAGSPSIHSHWWE